jgi:hypothetical protein
VVYLYLDNFSNALSQWMRSKKPGDSGPAAMDGPQKAAAE